MAKTRPCSGSLLLVLVGSLFLGYGGLEAAVTTVHRDSYVTAASPTTAFGPAETLLVNRQSIALLGGSLQSLPPGTGPNQIAKATLHLWVNKASPQPSGSVNVVPVGTAWQGPSVTWNTRPPLLTKPVATAQLLSGGTSYYLEVDVTELVRFWVATPAKNNGFAVTTTSATTSVAFDSKENTATSHPAFLDITVTSGKTIALCVESNDPRETCHCAGRTIISRTGISCEAVAESGRCTASVPPSGWVASCCVCAP